MKISCFLPCRAGSQRVPRKNLRPFAGYQHGLIEIKLRQLLSVDCLDQVVLSTNDAHIIEFAEKLDNPRLRIHRREDSLSSNQASTDALIEHAASLIKDGHILWTHVTSPFVTAEAYNAIIERYKTALEGGYDSLMTVTKVQGFLWDDHAPINYDRAIEKWPRTQTIQPLYEVNSAVFLASAEIFQIHCDRIGHKPDLFELNKIQGFDIDWPDDFQIAEALLKSGVVET